MIRFARISCTAAALLLLWGGRAYAAPTFPPLTGRVVDAANIIPPEQEAALTAKLTGLETQSGRQLVIATIPNTQGYSLSDYGYQLGRAWGIGQKDSNNGIILFLAPNEPAGKRGPRIEVGYGLEPIMTDALAHVITYDVMTPMLKQGDIAGALDKGSDLIIAQLRLPPEEAAKRAAAMGAESERKRDDVNVSAIIFWLFIFLFFILPMVRGLFGGKRRGRRFGGGPVVIWGGSDWGGGGGSSWGGGGGGFSGGGGSFGGGGASGGW